MVQRVVRVVFEPDGCCWCPFGVLFGDALLRYACHPQFLALPQFRNHATEAFRVCYDGLSDPLVGAWIHDEQVARIHFHDLGARTSRMQGEFDAAIFAVLFTSFAVARIEQIVDVFAIQGYQA